MKSGSESYPPREDRTGSPEERVFIVDDDALFVTAMSRLLLELGYSVSTYTSAHSLLDRLPNDDVPSCILLDVQMPGLDGPALQSRLNELGSAIPIIFLSGNPETDTVVRAIKSGAIDFLVKPVTADALLDGIASAIRLHRSTLKAKNSSNEALVRFKALTLREREVFELVVLGNTNKQVGRELGCTERTVKAHRQRVMEKLQVQSIAELVSLAARLRTTS